MRRFLPYYQLLKPVRLQFIVALVAGALSALATGFGLPFMLKEVFPVIFSGEVTGVRETAPEWLSNLASNFGNTESFLLGVAVAIMPLVFIIKGVSYFISRYYINYSGLKVLESIRLKVYNKVQHLSLSFHHKSKEGDLLVRVLEDPSHIQRCVVNVASDMVVQPLTLVCAAGFLIYQSIADESALFILIGLLTVPICVLPIQYVARKILKRARNMQDKSGDMTAIVNENLASQREVRAFNLQEHQVKILEKEVSILFFLKMKVVKYGQIIQPSVEIVSAIGVAFAIYFASQKGMTLEGFIPLLMALFMCYEPIKKIGKIKSILKTGEAALDRIEEVLNSEDEILEPKQAVAYEGADGGMKFENVHFAYDDGEPVLSDLNLTIPEGQTVALVGPSGAGKSSFVSLIPRFYDVSSGNITISGVDIKDMKKHELRSNIALVSQLPLLFRGTIGENIALGKLGASREDVIEAAKKANAHAFIMEQADGYDTHLSERGEGLSGGQRQRVAIARAFLRDAPILILDEATSALDNESEAQVQAELAKLAKGRTTFLIAHRFSSIRDAGRILVFDKTENGGEIIADGTHEEIYASCALYKQLYDQQA